MCVDEVSLIVQDYVDSWFNNDDYETKDSNNPVQSKKPHQHT